ncbi:MAG: class I SAM-dependent methyltransferase [Syntrophomonas sp.]|nr:class I SAM-dependent methyltransferase [Syntrophomonas sp.]
MDNIKWEKLNIISGEYTNPIFTCHRPCPICNSINAKSVWGLNGFQFFTDNPTIEKKVDIKVQQCMNCYAIYLNPAYSQIGFKYLFDEAGCSYGSRSSFRVNEEIGWLKQRNLLKPGLHVLDIGCYKGQFLAALPEEIICTGVDIDHNAIEYAQSQYGSTRLNFICADFEKMDLEIQPDLITMYHVLEHLPNPLEVLKRLRLLANDRTKLLIEVPILENGSTNDINGFFSVQHMTHFSRNSLNKLVSLAGWQIREKQEQADYNGCRVICEPDGFRQVDSAPNDLSLCYKYLSNWYQALVDVEDTLAKHQECNKWIIWGAGLHTEVLYQTTSFFTNLKKREYIIVDSDPQKQGKKWRGINIYNPNILKDCILGDRKILISSYGSQPIIEQILINMGINQENIVTLYKQIKVY